MKSTRVRAAVRRLAAGAVVARRRLEGMVGVELEWGEAEEVGWRAVVQEEAEGEVESMQEEEVEEVVEEGQFPSPSAE